MKSLSVLRGQPARRKAQAAAGSGRPDPLSQAILTFLVNHGLLAARRICSCGNQMVLRDD